jgi:ribose 1,5-bisphosphokinase
MSGVLVAVVGPSGAGKDALIRHAALELHRFDDVFFVRRLVTRAPGAFEDHASISEADFADGLAANRFALAWRAHGHGYAVPLSALTAVRNGAIAVCNLSRGAVDDAARAFGDVVTVLITAPAAVIAARLAERGRESPSAIEARVKRETELGDFPATYAIANDGTIAAGGGRLIEIINGFRSLHRQELPARPVTVR